MAYTTTNPPAQVTQGIGNSPSLWIYKTTDSHIQVAAVGYFTNGASLGMKVDDVMMVVDTDSATCTIHSAASAISVNLATLA